MNCNPGPGEGEQVDLDPGAVGQAAQPFGQAPGQEETLLYKQGR